MRHSDFGRDPENQVLLFPLALGIHISRNPTLRRIEALCPVPLVISQENVAIRRGVQRYTDFGPILKGLSSLQNLTTLKIIDAPILCPEIMDRLLTIIPSIPSLRTVAVAPRRVTDLEEDALLLPDLDRLQEISR
jgi:hypothetical protein